jgi:hypothetical protein
MARPRCSSALNSAPNSTATLEIHIQMRKTMTLATVHRVIAEDEQGWGM